MNSRTNKNNKNKNIPGVPVQIPASIADSLGHATHKSYEHCTEPDSYGVIRKYSQGISSITPDEHYSISNMSKSPYLALPRTLHHHYKYSALLPPLSLPHKHFSLHFATCKAFTSCLSSTVYPMFNHYLSSKTFFSHHFKTDSEDLIGFDAKKGTQSHGFL